MYCYFVMMNWLLYHYRITFFASYYSFCLNLFCLIEV